MMVPPAPISAPTTLSRPHQTHEPPLSPSSELGTELQACVCDFLMVKGINVFDATPHLLELDLTPNIIHDVPVPCLIEVMGVVEG